MMKHKKPLEVIHQQEMVVELYLDAPNQEVIELYHRAGGRQDKIVHKVQAYLQRYAGYPIGQRVMKAMLTA